MKQVLVRDIMSSPAICIDSQSTVPTDHLLMKEHNIRRLPVVDDGTLVGIITLGDVCGALPSEATTLNRFELSYLIDQLKVERVMTRNGITVTPDTSLAETARLMIHHKISGLPIVSAEGRVAGVVTESDVFRVLVEMLESRERPLQQELESALNREQLLA
jgi:acetoin utilization protein AcuB